MMATMLRDSLNAGSTTDKSTASGRTCCSTASDPRRLKSQFGVAGGLGGWRGIQSRPFSRYQFALKRKPASSPICGVHCNNSRALRMSYWTFTV
jgi:hypothetical protein